MCREYAGKQGYTILDELQEDTYSSGADLDLSHFNEVLDLARDGGFDVLVCREMDRLARGLAKQLYIEDELKRAGVRIEYALENYDDSPEGGLMKHVRASVAEYERLKIRERTKRGKRDKARAGNVYVGAGGAPYGYDKAFKDGRHTLEIIESEADVVKEVFELYLQGDRLGVAAPPRIVGTSAPKSGVTRHVVVDKRLPGQNSCHSSKISKMLHCAAYRGTWLFGNNNDNPVEVPVPAIVSTENGKRRRRKWMPNVDTDCCHAATRSCSVI